ncbi:MAG TPA: hypothetical protein VFS21_22110 [Roseiflexaceae bacterium]|nr:hypothetical protein [Roseiflexaceae bacterium]
MSAQSGLIRADIRDDEAMQANIADRVFYATGILLAADDFRDEQQYHRGRLARALQYLHGVGTVAGLRVGYQPKAEATETTPAQEEQLWVDAGLAVDRLGRLVELRGARCIRLERWYSYLAANSPDQLAAARHTVTIQADRDGPDEPPEEIALTGVVVDVFLRFLVCERGRTPAFASGPFDALDAAQPARLRDGAEVLLVPRAGSAPVYPADPYAGLDTDLDTIPDPADRVALRRHRLRRTLFDAWDETESQDARPRPPEVPEQIDPDSVFLARVVLPAGLPPASNSAPPRLADQPVRIDNASRLFALTPRALAAWLDL